jgi:basic membrane lipoprotein Med (substrate-binding protein (PBP1-ABC) superfamily)
MAKVVLLSCTKSKTKHAAPAQELYSASPMFQKTLEYGKSLDPDKMFILSAKHHLVPLTKKLEPYDKTLKEMPKEEKEKWGEETIKQMKSHGINVDKDHFIFLTGSEYAKPLLQYIPEKNIEKPMDGRRMGERLQWLNNQIKKLKEAVSKIKKIIYEVFQK